ncbi:helicase-exonuclease AddAB subunit AddB [Paenibacillus shirakamiensis]|nr:helicase-exonuclease AddAB subunit AddB [Paenibacillus shirakamiensis]
MSLQFIIGRSGSGKSSRVLEEIHTSLQHNPTGEPIIMLAPEQGTFQLERNFIHMEHIQGTIRLQILGFRRLALRIMQETGGSALIPISVEGKKMLLYRIINRRKKELKLYQNAGDHLGLIERINTLYSEVKMYGGDPAALEQQLKQMTMAEGETPLLQDKLHDLSLVYKEFEHELSGHYVDAEDHITKLAEGAAQSHYLRGSEIYIDGFYTFTPKEMEAIGQLLLTAKRVKICLTLDRPYDDGIAPHELNLFHPTAMVYMKLRKMAEALGIELEATQIMQEQPLPRFKDSPVLAQLESSYGTRGQQGTANLAVDRQEVESSLKVQAFLDRREELAGVARDMRRLASEQGARWRDMAIFVRDIDAYEHVAVSVLEEHDIPFFLDKKRTVLHHPLLEYVRGAVDVVSKYWRYEDVFRCVKTDFVLPMDGSISRTDMDVLENYVLASGIHGARWYDGRPWRARPNLSLEIQQDPAAEGRITGMARLEECREAVVLPLSALERRMKQAKSVREKCEALYYLLEDTGAPQRLDQLAHQALVEGKPQQAFEHRQIWGAMLDLLDQMVEMMGKETVNLELFRGMLETGMASMQLALVPPSLDQVLLGSTDRTRSSHVQHVFLLGVNEGVMPAVYTEEGILTEQERSKLTEAGIVFAPGITRQLLDERFLIYHALSSASRSLWISYPTTDGEGKAFPPSEVIRQVRGCFPALQEDRMDVPPTLSDEEELKWITHPDATLQVLISRLRSWKAGVPISPVWWSVLEWFRMSPQYRGVLENLLGSLDYRNRTHSLTESTSRKLYGRKLRTSVSRMERYAACPFSHFASHGLKLKERQMYRLQAPDIGQLFHAALGSMALTLKEQNRSWGSLSAEECVYEAEVAVDKLAPRLQGEILLSTKRYGYISRKLKNIVGRASIILGEQSRRGSFEPIGLELDFGPDKTLPPLVFELENGCVMEIVGRIDRVDLAQGEQGILLRVIDYKSSQTDLLLHEVYYGLSLQMLTYLDVIVQSAEQWLGQSALPAGALYFHVHNPLLQSPNAMEAAAAEQEMLKRFKMKGLLLADKEVIGHMDGQLEKGYSEIIPVGLKTDGSFYSASAVATPDQWDTLLHSVRNKIQEIGTGITDGDVAIKPYKMGQETACTYCSYKSVCQIDETMDADRYHILTKPDKEKTWNLLGERSGVRTHEEVLTDYDIGNLLKKGEGIE